jgi:hypothetical protein
VSLGKYAASTSVPVERSRAEVERVLTKYGATRFGTMSEETKVTVYFEVKGRTVQWSIPLPPKSKYRYEKDYDQEVRRRWRVLVITIKAMLEAVESKLLTFDEAFLPHIVIPGTGRTLGAAIVPKLDALYSGLSLPALLSENPE